MKYALTFLAERRVYMQSEIVVEIPDGIKFDKGKAQKQCLEHIDYFAFDTGVVWEELESDWPELTEVQSVAVADDQDYQPDIRFVQAEDGSLMPEGTANDGKSE